MERYARSDRMKGEGFGGNYADLYCQYQKNHELNNHSWASIARSDTDAINEKHKDEACEADVSPVATAAADVVEAISTGVYDPYLEMILAAGHNRKRALRGVPGFRR